MSTEYLVASSKKPPAPEFIAEAFTTKVVITGDWRQGLKVDKKLLVEISARDPRVKDVLPAAQRKTVFVVQGDFDMARAFAKHVAGAMLTEDGEILERFDEVAANATLPKKLLIAPKKAGVRLPDDRLVSEFMSFVGEVEGKSWESGYELNGVQARAARSTDKLAKIPTTGTVIVTLNASAMDDPEVAVDTIECFTRLLKGKLLGVDGTPLVLPSFE